MKKWALVALLFVTCSCRDSLEARTQDGPGPPVPAELHLLTYNVFLRPAPVSWGDESACRARRIGQRIGEGELDLAVLTETFRADDVRTLSALAARRLPNQVLSMPRGTGFLAVSGGLSVLSRWPIESTRTITYEACSGPLSDCLSAKGAVHAVVRLREDLAINVVATHLDAGTADGDRQARAAQLGRLRGFVEEIDPASGPTVLLGDFNIDALADDGEIDELTATLGVNVGDVAEPSTVNCETTIRCDEPVAPRRLDYIFAREAERRAQLQNQQHLPLEDSACGSRYLSDHRAVRAELRVLSPQLEGTQ